MSAADALITAMYTAGGSTPRPVSEWLALAQEHAGLRDAFREAFGKRLPTPPKLGLWLSERLGKTAGPLRLQGQYSGRRKALVYRVVDYVQIAELARQEAERQAQLRAQFEEEQRQRAVTLQAAAVQAHEPPPNDYMYEAQRYDSTGRPLPRKIVIDPRTGEPIRKRPEIAEQPKPAESEKPKPAPKAPGHIPKIFDNGQWRPMTDHEIAQSRPRAEAGNPMRDRLLFAGPFPGNGIQPSSDSGYQGPFGFYTRVAGH